MRRRGLTLVELLVIIFIIGVLIVLLSPLTRTHAPTYTDKDFNFDDWDSTAEALLVPPDSLVAVDMPLAGEWSDNNRQRTTLTLWPVSKGQYVATFVSQGSCGHSGSVELERRAEYSNGLLLLDRPVRELRGETYQRLYTVRRGDRLMLVPSIRLEKLSEDSILRTRGVLASDLNWGQPR